MYEWPKHDWILVNVYIWECQICRTLYKGRVMPEDDYLGFHVTADGKFVPVDCDLAVVLNTQTE